MKRLMIAAALIAIMVSAARTDVQCADMIYGGDWSNPERGLVPADFAFSPYTGAYVNDGLYIQVRFDDGSFLFGSFFIYKGGPYHRYGLLFTHVSKDNKRLIFKEEVQDSMVRQKAVPFLWQEDQSYVSGNGNDWRLVIKCEGLDADLKFTRLTPGWKPGNGRGTLDEQKNLYFWNVVMVPAAKVEGTLKVNGAQMQPDGWGYIDRFYQNEIPTHFAPVALSTYTMPDPKAPPEDRWFLMFTDNYGHAAFNNVRYPWLYLVRNDKIVFATKDFITKQEDYRLDPSIGEKCPFRFVVQGRQGADSIQFTAQGDHIVDSLDVFSQLPLYIKKVALTFVKRPVYFRLASTIKGTLHQNGQSIPFHSVGMSGTVYIK